MKRLLFLTSTVAPSALAFSGTIEQRRQEYIQAIKFYLSTTKYNILVVDNSDYDFSKDFPHESRLEALHFTETRPVTKGKGYAETLLMQYGFEHSKFIQEATQIIKITGRYLIKNINKQLFFCNNKKALYVDSSIDFYFAQSYFFIAPKQFFTASLLPRVEEMDDKEGVFLEHLLGKAIKKWRHNGGKYHEFVLPIYIIGHLGGSSKPYKAPTFSRYFMIFSKYLINETMSLLRIGR